MSRANLALATPPEDDPSAGAQDDGTFTIGDLAQEFGVTLRTLRFYESRGLISPARSGMSRIYSAKDRARLAIILKGKQLGFTLGEIRAMLASDSKAEEATATVGGLQLSRSQIIEQLELLKTQRQEIDDAIVELEATVKRMST